VHGFVHERRRCHDAPVAEIRLRPARPPEADLLSELALRSKGYWDYDQVFLDSCRAELTIRPGEVPGRCIVVAEAAGQILGFYSVDGHPPVGELGNMWVEPEWIGTGVGRRLWQHAMTTAQKAGFIALRIGSDPGAEGFYRAMGAQRIGTTPSASIPGRMLPLLQIQVPPPDVKQPGSQSGDPSGPSASGGGLPGRAAGGAAS
jgi:GNAT superfamily N-acetyltransferase